jgi:hypothetical protein
MRDRVIFLIDRPLGIFGLSCSVMYVVLLVFVALLLVFISLLFVLH